MDATMVARTVVTSGGSRRLKVWAQRSAKKGMRPASVRRTNEPVMRYAEIMMKASTPTGEPMRQAW